MTQPASVNTAVMGLRAGIAVVLAGGKALNEVEGESHNKRSKRLEKEFDYRCESEPKNCNSIATMTTKVLPKVPTTSHRQSQLS
jgi:hypothetical protein